MHKNKIILGLVFLSIFSVLAFIGYKLGNKVNKTATPISPVSEIQTPVDDKPKIIATKKINDLYYSLVNDNQIIHLYQSRQAKPGELPSDAIGEAEINQPLPTTSSDLSFISSFWYLKPQNSIYLLERRSTDFGQGSDQINVYTRTGSKWQMKNLYFAETQIYSLTDIVDYLPSQNSLVMVTHGGEGCASWGEIWLVSPSGKKGLLDLSADCTGGGDEYLGYASGRAYFFHSRAINTPDGGVKTYVDKVFAYNPTSRTQKTLITLTEAQNVSWASLDTEASVVLLDVAGKSFYRLSLEQGILEQINN